jgi:hypothetical protein
MEKFKGYVNAVRSLFPDVKFDNSAFLQRMYKIVGV